MSGHTNLEDTYVLVHPGRVYLNIFEGEAVSTSPMPCCEDDEDDDVEEEKGKRQERERISDSRLAKDVWTYKPIGHIYMGTPKKRWLEYL